MKPYIPPLLPRDDLGWAELVPLIGRANRAIARYDGVVQGLVNPAFPELIQIVNAPPAEVPPRLEPTVRTLDVVAHP